MAPPKCMVLPAQLVPPQRVLIHWADDVARRSTLAVAASLLRHVAGRSGVRRHSAGGPRGDAQRPLGVRTLLDARSEAQAVHGLEMRTELRFGAAADELQRQLSEATDQMLILGISDLESAAPRVRAAVRRAGVVFADDRVSALREKAMSKLPATVSVLRVLD